MKKVRIENSAGSFAEDKDLAAQIREKLLMAAVDGGDSVQLDFSGVQLTTQSFIHALIAEPLRVGGEDALKKMVFKGCSKTVRGIIETVVQYVLETEDDEPEKRTGPVLERPKPQGKGKGKGDHLRR
jgi:hypothetical protein